jgi:hypothetical protein
MRGAGGVGGVQVVGLLLCQGPDPRTGLGWEDFERVRPFCNVSVREWGAESLGGRGAESLRGIPVLKCRPPRPPRLQGR